MSPASTRGGVIVEIGRALAFVDASHARRLASVASIAHVPGAVPPTLGIAVADGQIVTVLSLVPVDEPAAARGPQSIVLCELSGEHVGLAGGRVVASGMFEADGDGVRHLGARAPALDVRALYAHAEAAAWGARAERRERAVEDGGVEG